MNDSTCLPDGVIEMMAWGTDAGADSRRHLEQCAACRERLEQAKSDSALLREMVAAGSRPREAPTEIPGYELHEEIHRGSQGVVYRGVQCATRRAVAVKIIHQGALASARQRQRFERETELLATLRHPNVVTVHDGGRTRDGGFFLAMELLEGRTLEEALEAAAIDGVGTPRRRAELRRTLALFADIADGVAAIHRRGIIHRDLKPQNILIDLGGVPHLLDFGVARAEHDDEPGGVLRTLTGEFVGTLAYAAPEQVAGDPRLVDIRADVYALGVILFRMLTRRPPYELAGSLASVVEAIRSLEPPAPSHFNPAIDKELDRVVLQALAKDPARRYESAGALERDLRRYLAGDPIDAMRGGRLYLLRKALARHRAAVVVAVIAVLTLAGYGAAMAYLYAKATAANQARMNSLDAVLRIVQSEDLHRRIDEETAERLLARIEQSLRGNLMDQAADAWPHFRELGLRQLRRGDPAAALRQFETALDMVRVADASNRAAVADLLHQRGRAEWFLGRYPDALGSYQAALDLERQLGGSESEAVAASLTHLGATLRALGRLDEAEAAQRQALELRRRLHGVDDARYGASLNNLGVLLRERKRHSEALALFEDALRIARRGGAGTEGLGASLHNLGLEQATLGHMADAERSLGEALEVKRRELEDDHPSVVSTRNELNRVRAAAAAAQSPATAPTMPPAQE